jgi:hypothetical protein
MAGPEDVRRTPIAMTAITGAVMTRPTAAVITSKIRFDAYAEV